MIISKPPIENARVIFPDRRKTSKTVVSVAVILHDKLLIILLFGDSILHITIPS